MRHVLFTEPDILKTDSQASARFNLSPERTPHYLISTPRMHRHMSVHSG